jgi:hypothetical protein
LRGSIRVSSFRGSIAGAKGLSGWKPQSRKGLLVSLKTQTIDMNWFKLLDASTWRARFLEAAENAARRVAEYLRNREDYDNAALWKRRELRIRKYARRVNTRDNK